MKEESRRIKPGEVKWLGMDYPLQIRAKGLSGRIGKKIVISQSELEKKVLSFLAKNSFVYLGQPFSEKVDFKHIGYYKIWLIDTAVALVDVYSVLFPDQKLPEFLPWGRCHQGLRLKNQSQKEKTRQTLPINSNPNRQCYDSGGD